MARISLVFLIVIHKLETSEQQDFGDRIKIPMWLTLIGLSWGKS